MRARRGSNIATVAVARKLVCLAWQLLTKQEDYYYERPALTFRKLRRLELTAGAPKRCNPAGRNGAATPDTPAQWKAELGSRTHEQKRWTAAVQSALLVIHGCAVSNVTQVVYQCDGLGQNCGVFIASHGNPTSSKPVAFGHTYRNCAGFTDAGGTRRLNVCSPFVTGN